MITVIEYTKNSTSIDSMEIEDIIQYIVDTIENNKSVFEELYNVKSIRSGTVQAY